MIEPRLNFIAALAFAVGPGVGRAWFYSVPLSVSLQSPGTSHDRRAELRLDAPLSGRVCAVPPRPPISRRAADERSLTAS